MLKMQWSHMLQYNNASWPADTEGDVCSCIKWTHTVLLYDFVYFSTFFVFCLAFRLAVLIFHHIEHACLKQLLSPLVGCYCDFQWP